MFPMSPMPPATPHPRTGATVPAADSARRAADHAPTPAGREPRRAP